MNEKSFNVKLRLIADSRLFSSYKRSIYILTDMNTSTNFFLFMLSCDSSTFISSLDDSLVLSLTSLLTSFQLLSLVNLLFSSSAKY
jgi:hypothetical protein